MRCGRTTLRCELELLVAAGGLIKNDLLRFSSKVEMHRTWESGLGGTQLVNSEAKLLK